MFSICDSQKNADVVLTKIGHIPKFGHHKLILFFPCV